MEPAPDPEPTTVCSVCGSPKPRVGKFCRACNHYDTWSDRSPLLSALRQLLVGTVLFGFVGIVVNEAADTLIKSSDELQKERERKAAEEAQRAARQNAVYEALHEELRAVRERLIRSEYRLTNEGRRCPFVGADSPTRCVEYIRALRQQVHEELFSLDWTTPLLFAQIDAQSDDGGSSSATVELALDTVVTVLRDNRDRVDGLDIRWAVECGGQRRVDGTCERIWECRRKYASAAAHCMSYASCMTFEAEGRLLARISGMNYAHSSAGCTAIREGRSDCATDAGSTTVIHQVFDASRGADRPVTPEECERLSHDNANMENEPVPPEPLMEPTKAEATHRPRNRPAGGLHRADADVVPPDPPD